MNILFVCSANRMRSRTAMEFFRMKFSRQKDLVFDSCGTKRNFVEATKQIFPDAKMIDKSLIEWSDHIICMEENHRSEVLKIKLSENVQKNQRIIVAGIQDNFEYMDPLLIDMLNKMDDNLWSY